MKKILFIATGGTIASAKTENGLTPAITSEELLNAVPQVKNLCAVDTVQPYSLDSTNMCWKQWIHVAEIIRDSYAKYDGFVIAHGTDTLSYAAATLSYLIQKNEKPVVLTGINLGAIIHSRLLFGSKTAMLKMVDGSEFDVAKRTTASTKLNEDDELLIVHAMTGEETVVMQSEKEMFLRIEASTIPEKKKGAVGVRGMKLNAGDALSNIYVLDGESEQTVEVKGKEVVLNRLRVGNRDTKGTKR